MQQIRCYLQFKAHTLLDSRHLVVISQIVSYILRGPHKVIKEVAIIIAIIRLMVRVDIRETMPLTVS